jgi:hypothetical protein
MPHLTLIQGGRSAASPKTDDTAAMGAALVDMLWELDAPGSWPSPELARIRERLRELVDLYDATLSGVAIDSLRCWCRRCGKHQQLHEAECCGLCEAER